MKDAEYAVVWPLGRTAPRAVGAGRPLAGLDGMTIGFLWDYVFKGAEMFEIIKQTIRARYSDVTFIDYDVFGDIHGSVAAERSTVAGLPDKLREHRVDAAIVGVAA